jgi:hypothetical protein
VISVSPETDIHIQKEGELYITSRDIPDGYLNIDNGAFVKGSGGRITYKTGDIYSRSGSPACYRWIGRRDDYIQVRFQRTKSFVV